jgi:hypothetical protein
MELYFDFLHRIATKRFGYVPWVKQAGVKALGKQAQTEATLL